MGWSIGYDDNWKRDIGYGVPAICDQPKCKRKIDRGLAYVCGAEPYGGEKGCGLFFCGKHLAHWESLCIRCLHGKDPFKAKRDVKEWIDFKMTDPSWAEWRAKGCGV